jgi:hypothetical protein
MDEGLPAPAMTPLPRQWQRPSLLAFDEVSRAAVKLAGRLQSEREGRQAYHGKNAKKTD